MKSSLMPIAVCVVLLLSACVTNDVRPSAETLSDIEPFTIVVPKRLATYTASSLKGVHLNEVERIWGDQSVRDFFSVRFIESDTDLSTEVCRGNVHSSTPVRYKSCTYFDAKVLAKDEGDAYRLTITPYRIRNVQGNNALFLPISLPSVTLNDWYKWMSDETLVAQHKMTSPYPPESIKGNLDRNLQRYSYQSTKADGTLRQFKDTYWMPFDGNMGVVIGASIYPYKNGTLAEAYIEGRSNATDGVRARDWRGVMAAARSRLEAIVAE